MPKKIAFFAVSCLVALTSIAQPANPFIGSWKVTFTGHTKKGLPEQREALLVVGAAGGSWRVYKESRHDPCGRSEVPIEISSVDEKQLIGKVKRSAVADFCKDHKLVLLRDEQGRVTGREGDTELTLTRQ